MNHLKLTLLISLILILGLGGCDPVPTTSSSASVTSQDQINILSQKDLTTLSNTELEILIDYDIKRSQISGSWVRQYHQNNVIIYELELTRRIISKQR